MNEFLGIEWAFWAWVILGLLAVLTEVLTLALIGFYIGLGAFAAAMAAALGAPTWLQILVFAGTSLAAMLVSRPYLLGRLRAGEPARPSNVHALIGQRAVVTSPIHNDAGTGQVRVTRELWTARSAESDSEPIPAAAIVRVERVDGVIAYVSPVAQVSDTPSPAA